MQSALLADRVLLACWPAGCPASTMPLRLPLVLLPRAVPLLLLLLARTEARDACLQPFGPRSIWNLPLGSGAKLVPAKIRHRDERFPYLSVDPDVLVLSGTRCGGSAVAAPVTPVVQSKSGSSGFFQGGSTGRCAVAAGAAARPYFSAPIPKDFIIPDCTPRGSCGWPWDDSQNYAAALLDADQETVHQIQPFQRCTDDGPATAADPYPPVALHDDSLNSTFGAHGGSAFSSIGGTLRLGELTPARAPYGPRHALKIELEAFNYYYKPCFKFPGKTCDGYQMHQKVRVWAACVLLGCVLVAGCVLAVRSGRCQRKRESSESSNGLAAPINTAEASDDNDDGAHGSSVSPESVCCCCRPRCQRGMAYAGGAIWLMLAIVSATAVAFPSLSASYRGTNPALQMGSLLAVPPSGRTKSDIFLYWK